MRMMLHLACVRFAGMRMPVAHDAAFGLCQITGMRMPVEHAGCWPQAGNLLVLAPGTIWLLQYRTLCLPCMQGAAHWFKTPHHYKVLGLAMEAEEADIRR
jgi:hypothetical protein